MAQIKVSKRRLIVTFDDIDIQLVYAHNWYINRSRTTNYAYTLIKGKQVYMHQLILSTDNPLLEVDHIDHNGLNNCRGNLRLVTHAKNMTNLSSKAKTNTGYPGVHYDESRKKYTAYIHVNRKFRFIGRFLTIEEAIAANKFARKINFGVD